MLRIDNLIFDAWGRRFFDSASVTVPAGTKVGLVGRNGVGKSTLFKLIKGELVPRRRRHQPAQDAPASARSTRSTRQRRSRCWRQCWRPTLERDALHARTGDRAARGTGRNLRALDAIDADRAPARAAEILSGLGFCQRRPASADGGVLRRLAHARGAGGGAVRRAGPAAAGRAHQLPRPGRRAVARGAAAEISPHRDRHQPRPRAAR